MPRGKRSAMRKGSAPVAEKKPAKKLKPKPKDEELEEDEDEIEEEEDETEEEEGEEEESEEEEDTDDEDLEEGDDSVDIPDHIAESALKVLCWLRSGVAV